MMSWLLYLFPLTCFSEQGWTLLGFEVMFNSSNYEQRWKEISFVTTVPVHVECSYPILSGKGPLVEYVNKELKMEAEDRFDCFVKEEIFSEEAWDEGFTLSYELLPAYQAPNLISIYGYDFQGRGGVHGCTYYEGKTFWQKGDSFVKLVLDDLFIKGSEHRQFLLRYCENYFKASGYGYYSSLSEFPPKLSSNDLDIFVLTNKGLMIVFRAYTVGGWADGPDTVLIPYMDLKQFIDPNGPLQAMLE